MKKIIILAVLGFAAFGLFVGMEGDCCMASPLGYKLCTIIMCAVSGLLFMAAFLSLLYETEKHDFKRL